MTEQAPSKRIEYLDGLRGIAALAVVLFHYFALWPDKLGYDTFNPFGIFGGGHFGVELFFMISGYVIFMTLQRSAHAWEFAKRRWVRLFPAMLIGSLVILLIGNLLPVYEGSLRLLDLIPGLTFIDPRFLQLATDSRFSSLDGAFWTLYIEAQFYIMAALLFFVGRKKNFALNFTLLTAILRIIPVLFPDIIGRFDYTIISKILITNHLPWFCVGIALFNLQQNTKDKMSWVLLGFSCAMVLLMGGILHWAPARILLLLTFILPLFVGLFRKILSWKVFTFLGFISYPLYLVHQNLGVNLVLSAQKYFPAIPSTIVSVLATVVAIALGWIIAKYLEPALQKPLKKWLTPRKEIKAPTPTQP